MKRLAIRFALFGVVVLLVGLVVFASIDHCGEWTPSAPRVEQVLRAHGPLLAGAARTELAVPLPIHRGGYPWPQPTVSEITKPLHARALLLSVAGQQVAIVSLDTLMVPADLAARIAEGHGFPVISVATHTHSGPGQYDSRLVPEVAALGFKNQAVFDALVKAGRDAIEDAKKNVAPVTMKISERRSEEFARPRSGDSVDPQLTRLQFSAGDKAVAELYLVSAHPTYVVRSVAGLDGDYPAAIDTDPQLVRMVLQSSGGNASAATETIETQAALLLQLFSAPVETDVTVSGDIDFGYAGVSFGLGLPDPTRAGPGFTHTAIRNALCSGAEQTSWVSTLRLGPVTLVSLPVEPSWAAGQVFLEQTRATRLIAMADGYEGYVEPEGVVGTNGGEAKRQFFGPDFLKQLLAAALLSTRVSGAP